MRTVTRPTVQKQITVNAPDDPLELFVYEEIQAAKSSNKPVSRYALTSILAQEKNMPRKLADQVVVEYCDEYFPSIPEYLGNEFLTPFIKTSALILAILGVGLLLWSLRVRNLGGNDRYMYDGAGILLLLAAAGYIRGIYTEKFSKVERISQPGNLAGKVSVE